MSITLYYHPNNTNPDYQQLVRLSYVVLAKPFLLEGERLMEVVIALFLSWKRTPSMLQVFAWKLLLNRLPTRKNLFSSGVIPVQDPTTLLCGLCEGGKESVDNIFVLCPIASRIWYSVCWWLGWEQVLPESVLGIFQLFLSLDGSARIRHCLNLI